MIMALILSRNGLQELKEKFIQNNKNKQVLSTYPHAENWVKFRSPLNISGALQQNSIAAFS